ncbi:MAG: Gfo/Idh/MocA family oxidoreductase [Candidatus Latescibacteria bacterium]|nr:Gfo/Idh/MocA family oxidoreductase [Candidatus Latescibacterota bacterium]
MNTYRVGFIGCGGIAGAHAAGYRAVQNAQIDFVAGADVNASSDRVKRFVERYGVKLYTDYREMLAKEQFDLVSVCTWPRTHCEGTIAAAEHGAKGIMSEKPMAVNLDEADRMIEACTKAGTTLAIGHEHRFDPQSVRAKELLRQGEIGRLTLAWGHCGADLMNNGTHVIDLINYFNDDVEPVWAMGQVDRRRKLEGRGNHPDMVIEDMAVGRVGYKNGVTALIELGEWAHPAYQFHLIGTDGIIDVNMPNAPTLKVLSSFRHVGWTAPDLPQVDVMRAELEELIDAVEGRAVHRSSAQRGRAALETIMGIFESTYRRALIEFPVTIRDFPLERMIKEGLL